MKKRTDAENLNAAIASAISGFKPPEELTVSQWADKKRRLSSESSAEPGPWRTYRTPYLREPMDALTDPKVHEIVMVAASQVGKSELELNFIGYMIDQDPCGILYIHPTIEDAKKFSKIRVAPMVRDSKSLRVKVSEVKSRDSNNTILQKSFPGGMLTMCGSNSASALASTPVRVVIGDEIDRWAESAGTEGDPWGLAMARTTTFYNKKAIRVSTPTKKNASKIEKAFNAGTRERWCVQCPECGQWHDIVFDNIRFEYDVDIIKNKKHFTVKSVGWFCPSCACYHTEKEMKKQPSKWIAENPAAYKNGVRSFWLNAFSSPWAPWESIILAYLEADNDPQKLQVVYNTKFGELWEDRGDLDSEDYFMQRRENYNAELPDGVLCLTCGVDTQDDRLEYEVVGFGHFGETWGIQKGIIMGRPNEAEVWKQLDDVIDHQYTYANGVKLKISMTFVDSGGHYTQEVYQACKARIGKRVFAIKGRGGEGCPYTSPPTKTKIIIRGKYIGECWLYNIGVDSGKQLIMDSLSVKEPGKRFCHYPNNPDRNYESKYFAGLLSERLVYKEKGKSHWVWEKIPGHERNEALDCRNYATAACKAINPDFDALDKRLKEASVNIRAGTAPLTKIQSSPTPPQKQAPPQRTPKKTIDQHFDDW